MTNVKKLIAQLKSLPPNIDLVGYDVRLLDTKSNQALHLFQLQEEQEQVEIPPPRKIGFV